MIAASSKRITFYRYNAVALLSFSSGLPFLLTQDTLQTWLASMHMPLTFLGWLSLLNLPYVTKFLWAPYVDSIRLPWSSHRLSWVQCMQLLIMMTLLTLAITNPHFLIGFMVLVFIIASLSATQDIFIDAYRIERLAPSQYGLGIFLTQIFYRIAMLVSGAGVLLLADFYSWRIAYLVMAGIMLLLYILTTCCPREPIQMTKNHHPKNGLFTAIAAWFKQPHALAILGLIASYTIADNLSASLLPTYLTQYLALSLTQQAIIYKTWGLAALITGTLIVTPLLRIFHHHIVLLLCAALVFFSLYSLAFITQQPHHLLWIKLGITLNQFAHGASFAALTAWLFHHCKSTQYTATHYAFCTAIAALNRTFMGPIASYIIRTSNWHQLFLDASMLLLIPLTLILYLRMQPVLYVTRASPETPST